MALVNGLDKPCSLHFPVHIPIHILRDVFWGVKKKLGNQILDPYRIRLLRLHRSKLSHKDIADQINAQYDPKVRRFKPEGIRRCIKRFIKRDDCHSITTQKTGPRVSKEVMECVRLAMKSDKGINAGGIKAFVWEHTGTDLPIWTIDRIRLWVKFILFNSKYCQNVRHPNKIKVAGPASASAKPLASALEATSALEDEEDSQALEDGEQDMIDDLRGLAAELAENSQPLANTDDTTPVEEGLNPYTPFQVSMLDTLKELTNAVKDIAHNTSTSANHIQTLNHNVSYIAAYLAQKDPGFRLGRNFNELVQTEPLLTTQPIDNVLPEEPIVFSYSASVSPTISPLHSSDMGRPMNPVDPAPIHTPSTAPVAPPTTEPLTPVITEYLTQDQIHMFLDKSERKRRPFVLSVIYHLIPNKSEMAYKTINGPDVRYANREGNKSLILAKLPPAITNYALTLAFKHIPVQDVTTYVKDRVKLCTAVDNSLRRSNCRKPNTAIRTHTARSDENRTPLPNHRLPHNDVC